LFLVEQALHLLLETDTDIMGFVGNRIHPTVLPQSTNYPAITYRQVSGEHVESLQGSSGLKRSRFRIFSTARLSEGGYGVAKQLDETIRLVLHGFTGVVVSNDPIPQTIRIYDIQVGTSIDLFDDPTLSYQTVTDYDIWVTEPQP
jgi:Protein of unknown function (DUF3168).